MPNQRVTIRPAARDDLDVIVSLTRATRTQLARWAPLYFNPAKQANELHAMFLEFMISSDDYATNALVADDTTIGFFVEHSMAAGSRRWVDDLRVSDESWWAAALEAIVASVASPWVTCVSSQDTIRAAALTEQGQGLVSSYWARSTRDLTPRAPTDFEPVDFDASDAAIHTFGGQAFHPQLPGALVVGSNAGYAIGSPSATPPIYDPGGPTTVIDQIRGSDRPTVLDMVLAAAAARGDAQVVVVCGRNDDELTHIVEAAGFDRVVDLIGT